MAERRERPFARIMRGLEDALAFAKGDHTRGRLLVVRNGLVVEVDPSEAEPSDENVPNVPISGGTT